MKVFIKYINNLNTQTQQQQHEVTQWLNHKTDT